MLNVGVCVCVCVYYMQLFQCQLCKWICYILCALHLIVIYQRMPIVSQANELVVNIWGKETWSTNENEQEKNDDGIV